MYVTDMRDPWDMRDSSHTYVMDRPNTYQFFDASQNTHNSGQTHADRLAYVYNKLRNNKRPINNVKIYGASTGRWGSDAEGIERFWRNIFGGAASVRFHRPASGLGLTAKAQTQIKSTRMITDAIHIFTMEPRNDLLSNRETNEAYLLAEVGKQYAIYFTGDSNDSVRLNLSGVSGEFDVQWLHNDTSTWQNGGTINGGSTVTISTPSSDEWTAVLLHR